MRKISVKTAVQLINSAKCIFSVKFFKRSDGKLREMNCMLGSRTRKGLSGGELNYKPSEHDLIPVYIMNGDPNKGKDKDRRSIPVEGLVSLTINGATYEVE